MNTKVGASYGTADPELIGILINCRKTWLSGDYVEFAMFSAELKKRRPYTAKSLLANIIGVKHDYQNR
jgi:hypothetical protein